MIFEDQISCFEPIARADARLLILGTMPSLKSLEQGFYYAHPRNAFWPIVSDILGKVLPGTAQEKRSMLLRHRIALWDVVHSCVRSGSLDSAIRDVEANDFKGLFACCTGIRRILFNGTVAERLYKRHVGFMPQGCCSARMPSTSPAYTLEYERKREAWHDGMAGYYD